MSQQLQTISPIDGAVIVRRDYVGTDQARAMLQRARDAQELWREVPLEQRAITLSRGVDAFVSHKAQIAEELTRQMGRPLRYTPGEVGGFEARARHMIAIAPGALQDVVPAPIEGFNRFIRREPLGVVLVIAPWNYPLLTAVNSVVPALMAGNAVLLKHSAQTPLAAERIVESLAQAGLPHDLLQFIHTDHDGTHALIQAPQVDGVCFTGSVAGGAAVERAAAGRFIQVGLELGGNDPAYVRADAKLDHAVETLVDGAFFNSGQSCCGIQRIYVQRSVYAEFVEQAVALTRQYVLGNPLDPATTLGPVVRASAADAVRATIAEAMGKGAKGLIDSRAFKLDAPGSAYVAPQILVDVNHGMQVMSDECFGPVVGIMPVDSDDEALRLMNDSPYGLTAALFTQDEEAALKLGKRLQTGTVFMNRCDYLDPALAWTGVKNTGRGATLSTLGYEHLTRPKSFHLKRLS
jgi:acyl-CoA reductase-like NAD-dependent aldehyde dehydrogenase